MERDNRGDSLSSELTPLRSGVVSVVIVTDDERGKGLNNSDHVSAEFKAQLQRKRSGPCLGLLKCQAPSPDPLMNVLSFRCPCPILYEIHTAYWRPATPSTVTTIYSVHCIADFDCRPHPQWRLEANDTLQPLE